MCCGTPSRTNSVGGDGTVTIAGLNCPAIAGMDNELNVAVLSGDGSCDLGAVQHRVLAARSDSTLLSPCR
jgi:hypothetical protein